MRNWNSPNSKFWNMAIWIAIILGLVGVFVWIGALEAEAQEGDITGIVINPTDDALTILIKVLVILVGSVAIPALGQYMRAKGWAIEAKHTNTLHSALDTASNLVLDPVLTDQEKRDRAIAYIKMSVPEALRALGASDDLLWLQVQAYINKKTYGMILGESDEFHAPPGAAPLTPAL